jgi:hypothetical protein
MLVASFLSSGSCPDMGNTALRKRLIEVRDGCPFSCLMCWPNKYSAFRSKQAICVWRDMCMIRKDPTGRPMEGFPERYGELVHASIRVAQ